MMGSSAVEKLFSRPLPVMAKFAEREERKQTVLITLEMHSTTSPLHTKELVVRLTDETDLFFLYTLRLNEEDFQSLKAQQGLLVDFSAFPQRFVDLLELCLQEQHKESPKFILHLVSSDKTCASLNVIETNPFKHLTHLSLRLVPGADSDVKKYLADCLKLLKDQYTSLQTKQETTEAELKQRLHQTQQALSAKTLELDNLKGDWTSKTNSLSNQHAREMTAEREKALQLQSSYQQRYERERKELEQAHMKIVQQTEARLYELEGINKDLTDRKYKSEAAIRELKSKLSSLEDEHHHMKQELVNLRKENSALDSDYHEQEKQINQLKTKVAVLEQELKDKDQVLARSSDLLGSEQEQKHKYEEEIKKKQQQIVKFEQSTKAMSEELIKGNQIIQKLQGEIKAYHGKLKLRNQITTEQEKLLGEKEDTIQKTTADNQQLKETLRQREEENRKLNETLDTTTQKLEESRQIIKTNENVINWLNKQVTDSQLSGQQKLTHGTFEMPSSGGSSFRPTGSALHNFSTPAVSSIGRPSFEPTPTIPHHPSRPLQPQVQYKPVQTHGPVSKSTPVPPIPEEISPVNTQQGRQQNRQNKENDPPLSQKYLQPGQAAVPLRHMTPQTTTPPTTQLAAEIPLQKTTRLSQQVVVPKLNPRPQPPLVSSYFPSKPKTT